MSGGSSSTGNGTIFSINTDGSGFTLLHKFAGGANDGSDPRAGLAISGSTLFGTTLQGGDSSAGTVFSINTDGSDFTLLHEFPGQGNDGSGPWAGLMLSGSKLFGTTLSGGNGGEGTLFSINTNGSDFTLLHEFAGGVNDGRVSLSIPTLSGSTLFGTTARGGGNDLGTVFAFVVPEPSALVLAAVGVFCLFTYARLRHKTA